jgi:hypothetical protein
LGESGGIDWGGVIGSIGLEQLPKELLVLPSEVKFKPSKGTLKERMMYL